MSGSFDLKRSERLKAAIAPYTRSGYGEVDAFSSEPYADHWFEKAPSKTISSLAFLGLRPNGRPPRNTHPAATLQHCSNWLSGRRGEFDVGPLVTRRLMFEAVAAGGSPNSRLNARLNAASDSYPTSPAISATPRGVFSSDLAAN